MPTLGNTAAMIESRNKARGGGRPIALHERAEDDLRFIRATMEGAARFTGLSGKGFVLIGLSAFGAAALAAAQQTPRGWLLVWLAELPLAAALGLLSSARKARAQGSSLASQAGRKLLFAFTPPMLAGGLLTLALYQQANLDLVPGMWLCLYGAGVLTGSLHSIAPLPAMGAIFMALGTLALLAPATGPALQALGFGGLHLLFGALIWRRHGG